MRAPEWRPALASSIGAVTLAGPLCALAALFVTAAFLRRAGQADDVFGILLGLACLVSALAAASVPSMFIRIERDRVTIRNQLWSQRAVQLCDIAEVRAGLRGLVIRTRQGRSMVAAAVQQPPWLGSGDAHLRSLRVIAAIEAAVAARRADS